MEKLYYTAKEVAEILDVSVISRIQSDKRSVSGIVMHY